MAQGLRFEFRLHQEPVLPFLKAIKERVFAHCVHGAQRLHAKPFLFLSANEHRHLADRTRRFMAIGQNLTANQQTRL
jgi:hypothetical protein